MPDEKPEVFRAAPFAPAVSPAPWSPAVGVACNAGPGEDVAAMLRCALDEVDYGMLLVGPDGRLLWLNHAAREALGPDHPLQCDGRTVRAAQAADAAPLAQALAAARRGCRTTLALGSGGHRVFVTVRPIVEGAGALPAEAGGTLLMLEKGTLCGTLAVHGFARAMGLTPAETRVLEQLCDGLKPTEIASANRVGIATVRTQIGAIRHKVGARSIRDLQRRIASLPPMVSALRSVPASNAARLAA